MSQGYTNLFGSGVPTNNLFATSSSKVPSFGVFGSNKGITGDSSTGEQSSIRAPIQVDKLEQFTTPHNKELATTEVIMETEFENAIDESTMDDESIDGGFGSSKVTEAKIISLWKNMGNSCILPHQFKVPAKFDTIDDPPQGYFTVFMDYFQNGLTIPPSPLLVAICHDFKICLSQLTPNAIRIFNAFCKIMEKFKLPVTAEYFHAMFCSQRTKTAQFVCFAQHNNVRFLTSPPRSPTGWKEMFFHVKDDELGVARNWASKPIKIKVSERIQHIQTACREVRLFEKMRDPVSLIPQGGCEDRKEEPNQDRENHENTRKEPTLLEPVKAPSSGCTTLCRNSMNSTEDGFKSHREGLRTLPTPADSTLGGQLSIESVRSFSKLLFGGNTSGRPKFTDVKESNEKGAKPNPQPQSSLQGNLRNSEDKCLKRPREDDGTQQKHRSVNVYDGFSYWDDRTYGQAWWNVRQIFSSHDEERIREESTMSIAKKATATGMQLLHYLGSLEDKAFELQQVVGNAGFELNDYKKQVDSLKQERLILEQEK